MGIREGPRVSFHRLRSKRAFQLRGHAASGQEPRWTETSPTQGRLYPVYGPQAQPSDLEGYRGDPWSWLLAQGYQAGVWNLVYMKKKFTSNRCVEFSFYDNFVLNRCVGFSLCDNCVLNRCVGFSFYDNFVLNRCVGFSLYDNWTCVWNLVYMIILFWYQTGVWGLVYTIILF